MVEVVSIIIAIVSFVGALVAAGITAWVTIFSDERKRLSEAEKLVGKYRDPLLLAAQDLQSRLYNIVDQEFTRLINDDERAKDNVLKYTCFLVGQYLSWTHILRRESQFLRFSTDKDNRDISAVLLDIRFAFLTHRTPNSGTVLQYIR